MAEPPDARKWCRRGKGRAPADAPECDCLTVCEHEHGFCDPERCLWPNCCAGSASCRPCIPSERAVMAEAACTNLRPAETPLLSKLREG